MATTLTQTSYRFRNDDGDEAGASWLAAENTAPTIYAHKNYRARFLVTESGGTAWTAGTASLYYSTDGSNFSAAGANTPIQAAGSKWYANGVSSTEQITSAGTFSAVNTGMINDAVSGTVTISASEEAEIEFCFQVKHGGNDISDGDTLYLAVYNDTTALDAYTNDASFTLRLPGGRRG